MDGASGTAGFMFDYLFQIGYTRLFSFVESMMIRFAPSEHSGWGLCPWYPKHNNELNETYIVAHEDGDSSISPQFSLPVVHT